MNIQESISTPVTKSCDVLVVGGGFGGIAAAVSAAREGKKVILAEREYMFGGLGTAGLVNIYLPICDGCGHQVSFGLAEELLLLCVEYKGYEIRHKHNGYSNWVLRHDPADQIEGSPRYSVFFNPQLFAISAEQFLLRNHVQILYGTAAVAVSKKAEDKLDAVIFENKSGRFAIRASAFVDASGDADLAKFSGAPTVKHGTGNKLAAWYDDATTEDLYHRNVLGVAELTEEDIKNGVTVEELSAKRWSGLDGDENTDFVIQSHASILRSSLQKQKEHPEFELATIPTIPQFRMTRRINGEYTLDYEEMHKEFDDSCGMVGNWKKPGPVYEVPFRTLYSAKVKNLLFAGRVTSVTDDMWELMRVIPCCSVTGEAAGLAAAMTDDCTALDIAELQKKLRGRGIPLHEKELK